MQWASETNSIELPSRHAEFPADEQGTRGRGAMGSYSIDSNQEINQLDTISANIYPGCLLSIGIWLL